MKALLNRLLPGRMDNDFDGHRAALWLLGLFIALKLAMSVNSILNTASVAAGADGLPLDDFGPAAARAVLMLFALVALGQLTLAAIALIALVRYRAMVPLMYLVLLGEQLARRLIVQGYAVERTEGIPAGWYVNLGILALLTIGLVLSLMPARQR
ncbi:MAG TPA: hypothetical protein VD701_03950 [Steroidobacteraceae bacterium]|nr:hypothetical protein [Steroidobacteraceae bacterium]